MTLDTTTFEHHLARLDTESLVSFVADVWAARGFETDVEGHFVVASRDGSTTVCWVVGKRCFRRATPPDRAVDVVVSPAAGETTRAVAQRQDARLLDATALRELLWYGIDRPIAVALCERYLGATPEALHPPVSVRARRCLAAVDPPESRTFVVSLVALGLLVAAGLGIPSGWLTENDVEGIGVGDERGFGAASGGDETPIATDTADPSDSVAGTIVDSRTAPNATTANVSGVSDVPGLSADGIDDLSALARAHEQAVENRSYTLWLDVYEPQEGDPDGPRLQRDIDVAVDGGRYLLVTETEVGDNRTRVGSVYHEGADWFVEGDDEANASWRQVTESEASVFGPNPFVLAETGVEQFLSTPETAVVGRLDIDGETHYRVVGRGPPNGTFSAQMMEYTVVALVDETGFVTDLAVDYTVVTSGQPYRVRFEWTYGNLDETVVDAPVPRDDGA
ncbi:hypothetical protein SAMN04487950_0175 [Halogranum rubrum]|uniref:Uncharacterized protein n=1 Tax=Halogranum rubrum TaxID=553466 RepID=A0A1I4AXQ9_9EURY|nr:hypothetical protein [Halogranum rubrum]SFK61285.1 hypothetical protein SAMN04487950_0175 [Halogranum rubrum]